MASISKPKNAKQETFRQKWQRWMRPPRQLSLTTAGKFFVLITIGVGFGAINTGQNLLFLLLGMMLSLMVASGILSEAVLRELRATRRAPGRITAGMAAPGSYRIENPKGFASLSITVSDRNAKCVAGPMRGQLLGYKSPRWWQFWKKTPTDAASVSSGYTLRLAAGETQTVDAHFNLPRRGLYQLGRVTISTRFPFSLFDKSRDIDTDATVVAFPVPDDAADWAANVYSRFGDVDGGKAGHGDEFFALRDYRQGEDRRSVHWKVSAKRGDLVVKETELRVQRAVEIVFCTQYPGKLTVAKLKQFEEGLAKTAGLVDVLTSRGYRVGLTTLTESIAPGDGGLHVDRMMHELALAELEVGDSPIARKDKSIGRIAIGFAESVAFVEDPDLVLEIGGANG